jgi:outer membrane protein insertion porin family
MSGSHRACAKSAEPAPGGRGARRPGRRSAGLLLALTLAPGSAFAQAPEPPVTPVPDTAPAAEPEPSGAPETASDPGSAPEPEPVEPKAASSAPAAERCPCPDQAERDDGAVRYTLEAIDVRGNSKTRTRVVLRYVPFKPGDVFDVDDPEVQLTRYRLLGTGFFRDVQFSLKKGSRRGLVVLVIEVVERNTIVINDVYMGLSADADTRGNERPLTPYGGIDVAETNLLGTGITLGAAMAFAQNQYALRLRFFDPAFLGGPWMTSGTLLYNDVRDFFGNARVQVGPYLPGDPGGFELQDSAIVSYVRSGGSLGLGRDLSISTQFWLHYRLESIEASYPLQASHQRGFDTEPIDFDIIRGRSVLSTLRGSLQIDTRDHPFLPTHGWFSNLSLELALLPAGLDYDYQRIDLQASRWWKLPWQHVVRLDMFAGAISGDAPFFEQYYVGDFSDFLPDRVLGVNFDRRPPRNFLGTQIAEVRYGDYAFKLGGEYRIPLYRGHHSVYGIDFFGSAGVYGVAGDRDLTAPPSAYSGFALVPIDLTANIGFRMDTSAGGFVFAFSNILGFVPVRGKGPAGE